MSHKLALSAHKEAEEAQLAAAVAEHDTWSRGLASELVELEGSCLEQQRQLEAMMASAAELESEERALMQVHEG